MISCAWVPSGDISYVWNPYGAISHVWDPSDTIPCDCARLVLFRAFGTHLILFRAFGVRLVLCRAFRTCLVQFHAFGPRVIQFGAFLTRLVLSRAIGTIWYYFVCSKSTTSRRHRKKAALINEYLRRDGAPKRSKFWDRKTVPILGAKVLKRKVGACCLAPRVYVLLCSLKLLLAVFGKDSCCGNTPVLRYVLKFFRCQNYSVPFACCKWAPRAPPPALTALPCGTARC